MMQFFLQLATQPTLHCKLQKNCMCNTPFSQPAMQQNVALQVAAKVEQSSTFPNVVRQVAACTISSATCNIIVLESANQSASTGVVTTEILIIQLVNCKLQKKIV